MHRILWESEKELNNAIGLRGPGVISLKLRKDLFFQLFLTIG